MTREYIAHINEITHAHQSVKAHSEATAQLCRSFSAARELDQFLYNTGLLHDIGKYQASFQARIAGKAIHVEHSACGAIAAEKMFPYPLSLMMEYCIAGHHGGLPDGGLKSEEDKSGSVTLKARLKRSFEDYSVYQEELALLPDDFSEWLKYITQNCGYDRKKLVDQFAFFTRYAFSCLVDADSLDTADFCKTKELPRALHADFTACLDKIDKRLASFSDTCETDLQRARALVQQQAFKYAEQDAEIYLMNMPTGSGKTLAGMKVALERLKKKGKKRIIYVIPYNAIIDQTAQIFEKLFQESAELLRHQSSYQYEDAEDKDEDYRAAAKAAIENWNAPIVITTAVQFFESVYSNKRGKLRKMHNMADSVIVFDEAHLMPQAYLQPCLQAVAYITRYLNSEALFLTATMPDFKQLMETYALRESEICDLIQDKTLFQIFQKCRYTYIGSISDEALLEKSRECPSSLIVVNKRKTARRMYQKCGGIKFHLSTYMTARDRQNTLEQIRIALDEQNRDFPAYKDIPEERRITVISTSLIEAGVDIDMHTVFRETAGLDNILQSGGRCNREGKRKTADVFVYDLQDEHTLSGEKENLTKGLLRKYQDISEPACIKEYYDRLYFMKRDDIQKNTIHQICDDIGAIPFRGYAEQLALIDTKTVSLVVAQDEYAEQLVNKLRAGYLSDMRKLQQYTCSIYQNEADTLLKQKAAELIEGVHCLTNLNYYKQEFGISV